MQKLMTLKNKKGFTLIEMLIVILIIVILLAIAIPSVIAYREDSQRTADLGAAKTAYTALESALTRIGTPVTGGAGLTANGDGTFGPDHPAGPWVSWPNTGDSRYLLNEANKILGSEYTGKIQFGYNPVSNSIDWVSYHEHKHSGGDDNRTTADSNVMLYHVADGVSGYLDEVPDPYKSENAYKHNW